MPSKVFVKEFENFITTSSSAETADELFSYVVTSLGQLGYDQVVFSIITDKDLSPEAFSLGVQHNISEDWIKNYIDKRLDLIDPIKKHIEIAYQPYKWGDLGQVMPLHKKQIDFLEETKEAKLYNGITIPLRGARAQLSCLAIASSEEVDSCETRSDIINAYAQQFFLCYKRFFPNEFVETDLHEKMLTPKENLILTWVANGKTDEEIATIIGISRHTVDTHMRHIFQKLDVTNRIQAVVKALLQGLITP